MSCLGDQSRQDGIDVKVSFLVVVVVVATSFLSFRLIPWYLVDTHSFCFELMGLSADDNYRVAGSSIRVEYVLLRYYRMLFVSICIVSYFRL
jgi:hypothetical protein